MLPQDYDGVFKIIIIGNSGVGKSSILNQYFVQEFFEKFKSTIGVDLKIKSKTMPNQKVIKIQLYDTAGQEKFKSIVSSYYKGANGVLLVYDITNRNSFIDMNTWYNDIKQYAKQDVEIILVGNKKDLESQRNVSTEDGLKLAQSLNCYFIEATAKEYQSVDEAFDVILTVIYEKEIENRKEAGKDKEKTAKVNLNITSQQDSDLIDIRKKDKKCC